jgi:hypothetical protein
MTIGGFSRYKDVIQAAILAVEVYAHTIERRECRVHGNS